jgi:hypothetical protein
MKVTIENENLAVCEQGLKYSINGLMIKPFRQEESPRFYEKGSKMFNMCVHKGIVTDAEVIEAGVINLL